MTPKSAILRYHSISGLDDRLAIDLRDFRRHMEFISGEYGIIRLSALQEVLLDGHHTDRKVVVTFDDAYTDFEEALPVLERLRIPVTLFVPTGSIGGLNDWDKNDARYPRRRIMTNAQLQALVKTGLVDLGSHSVDHVRMSTLSEKEMRRQAAESKAALERIAGSEVTAFSYPHGQLGDFSGSTTACLEQTGYRIAVTAHWGTRNSANDLMCLRRIRLEAADPARALRAKIDGRRDWRTVKEQLRFGIACRTRIFQ